MSEQKTAYVGSVVELSDAPVALPAPAPGEPNPNIEKAKALLLSRKFWAALVGLVLVVVKAYKPDFPIAEDQVTNLVYVLVAYILGVALEDGLSSRAVKNASK